MGCAGGALSVMHDNFISFPGSTTNSVLPECGVPLDQWQKEGHDLGTTVGATPPAHAIIFAAKGLLL